MSYSIGPTFLENKKSEFASKLRSQIMRFSSGPRFSRAVQHRNTEESDYDFLLGPGFSRCLATVGNSATGQLQSTSRIF